MASENNDMVMLLAAEIFESIGLSLLHQVDVEGGDVRCPQSESDGQKNPAIIDRDSAGGAALIWNNAAKLMTELGKQ
jgi:hypothetical protein